MAAQPARRARDPRIEALRLAAILAIAVFHTFQPLFARTAACVQLGDAAAAQAAAAAGDPAAAFALCPPAAGALGFINLLGAFGNCAFFAISGFFLIPAAASAAGRDSYWRDQARRCVRRAGTVLSSVLLYAVLALAVSAWVTPLPGVSLHETGWLLGGLEFIWVYLALIAATPVIGALWARCPHPVRLTALIVAAVYAVNAYIAFASPGEAERGLLEWRKLMSAASYLAAFLAGGALAWRREHGAKGGRTARARILPLVATAACAAVLELGLAWAGAGDLMVATSFKSTSAISFALALLALRAACTPRSPAGPDAGGTGPAGRLAVRGASHILGFYIMQSMFYALWRPAADAALSRAVAAALPAGTGAVCLAATAAGIIASLLLVIALLAVDAALHAPARCLRARSRG